MPPGGTPHYGLCGVAPPERGIFFRVRVYERVGKPVIAVFERTWKGSLTRLIAVKRTELLGLAIYLNSNDGIFRAFQKDLVCQRGTIYH